MSNSISDDWCCNAKLRYKDYLVGFFHRCCSNENLEFLTQLYFTTLKFCCNTAQKGSTVMLFYAAYILNVISLL